MLRCRVLMQAATLYHELTEESSQTIVHLRSALSLCSRPEPEPALPTRLRLSVLCTATTIVQGLVVSGALKDARVILEILQGVLQQRSADEEAAQNNNADAVDGGSPSAASAVRLQLLAHVSVVHVSMLQREGQLLAAGRLCQTTLERVSELPEDVPSHVGPADRAGRAGGAAASDGRELICWAPREVLRGALEFLHALILAQQGELAASTTALDAIIANATSTLASPSAKGAGDGNAAAASARLVAYSQRALADEARLLRATIHLAALEFDEALALAQELRGPLCAPGAAVGGESGFGESAVFPPRRSHGLSSWLLLLAQASLCFEQNDAAAALVQRARKECERSNHFGISHWCQLLEKLLVPSSAKERQEKLRELGVDDNVRTHRLLRGALLLYQGELSLELGNVDEAEKRLTRCVKLSVGESRCDALTASGLTSLACAVGAQAEGEGGGGGARASADGDTADGEDRESKRRRTEDSLSSALMLAAQMDDLHAQRRALRGWADHYESIGDEAQATQFGDLHAEFHGKLERKLAHSKGSTALRALAEEEVGRA